MDIMIRASPQPAQLGGPKRIGRRASQYVKMPKPQCNIARQEIGRTKRQGIVGRPIHGGRLDGPGGMIHPRVRGRSTGVQHARVRRRPPCPCWPPIVRRSDRWADPAGERLGPVPPSAQCDSRCLGQLVHPLLDDLPGPPDVVGVDVQMGHGPQAVLRLGQHQDAVSPQGLDQLRS